MSGREKRRKMFLESLEQRQVLATVVEAFTPTASGFIVDFSAPIQTSTLNLYDAQNGLLGPADVVVQGTSSGIVHGTLVVEGDKLIFVKTGGPLAPDTYTVTLRSASNGIVDQALGELLDGEYNGSFPSGNGTPGGDFVFSFTVGELQDLVVSIPDFARGPTQELQSPPTGSGNALTEGLPIRFSQVAGVTSFTMTINYDPSLLTITGVELGKDAPANAQVQANTSIPGQVTLAFFAIDPLEGGAAELVKLVGTVPEDATYGATQALTISAIEINSGAIQATTDAGVHVVAFPGDANANRRYDAEDARLIARTGLNLDSGFVTSQPTGTQVVDGERLYPYVDPVIIGDVTGVDGLSPLDASDLLRRVVGLPTPNIPALPAAQAPTGLALSSTSVGEGLPVGTVVGTFTTTDPDTGDTHTYSLVSGEGSNDNASFTIEGNVLKTAAVFDQNVKSSYTIRVRTTDSTNRTFERTFTITVTDVNSAPTALNLSNNSVAENSSVGTAVGTLTTDDPNSGDTFTYSLVSGEGDTDNAAFTIVGDQLLVNSALDFETKNTYSIRIRTTDQGGLSTEQVFTISVTNVNEAPTAIALSNSHVPEGLPVSTVVGTFSATDPDAGDTFTFALVAGEGDTGNSSFFVNGNELVTNEVFNRDTQETYSIRVRVTDAEGLSFEQTFTITITAENVAPTAIELDNSTIDENVEEGTVVGNLSTTDPNGTDTHTYTLVAGEGDTDNAAFVIVGNQLQTAADVDFETKSSYSVRVRSTDPFGLSVEQVFTISVNDLNEAPTAIDLSNSSVPENSAVDTAIGQLTAEDPDAANTHTFELVAGEGDDDNALFSIVGNELRTAAQLDFEAQSTYSVRVKVTDQDGQSFEQILTITATDVNEAPTALTLSSSTVAENEPAGTAVGAFSTTDPDTGNTFTYTLVEGEGDTDNASFTIDGNILRTAEVFDQEVKNSYSIRVRTTDQDGLSFEQTFTITITEENVAPTAIELSANSIDENVPEGTEVGTFSTTDANAIDTHTYELVSGDGDTDNGAFTIEGNVLKTNGTIDFESQSSYSIRVRSTDPFGLYTEETFTITVNDVNEAPTEIQLSNSTVAEDAAVGTVIGTLSTTDPDSGNTHTFSLVSGEGDEGNSLFEIVDNELRLADSLNFEDQASYSIRVRTEDQDGESFEQVFTITVTDVNEAPTALELSSNTVAENEPVGTEVGTFSTTDPDADNTFTYTLVAGEGDTDNDSFTIDGNILRTAEVFDAGTKSSYSIRVRTTDQDGLFFEQTLTITVTAANSAPTAIELSASSIDENAPEGTEVGTLSTVDPDEGDTHTYELVAGEGDTDNGAFTIEGNVLKTNAAIDFESQSSYSIRVRSTDSSGLYTEEIFTINVNDVNEAPTEIALSNDEVAEGQPAGTVVGTFSTVDPDSGDTHTYALVAGEGDTDNAAFVIVGNELQTNEVFDYSTQSTYSIRVASTDQDGLTTEQVLTIHVTAANAAPTSIELDANTVEENSLPGTVVGTFTTIDPDAGDTHIYELVAGEGDTDNASFAIVGNTLQTTASFDYESQSSYSIRVRSTDADGLFVEQTFTINVTDLNEQPTGIELSNNTVPEDASVGTVIGLLTAIDPDLGNTHTFTLVSGEGDEGNDAFQIVGNELQLATALDFETQSSYSIRVRATDQDGESFEFTFEILVTQVEE
jgi:VCBS repeat-containing protein